MRGERWRTAIAAPPPPTPGWPRIRPAWSGPADNSPQAKRCRPSRSCACWRECAETVRGAAPSLEGATYGSDLRLLVNEGRVPSVLFGPGTVRMAHMPDEYVEVAQVVDAARALALLITRFCGTV